MLERMGELTEVPEENEEGQVPDMVVINDNSHGCPLLMTGMGQASCHTCHMDSL